MNAYDEIAYLTGAFQQTHPDRLAANARLFGLQPAPITQCRVLEIGAGDGTNLIPMAMTCPNSLFVGFDLAAEPVGRGVELVHALGLANVRLLQGDILDVDLGSDPFDYIIAHGIYSWVPDVVRAGLMRLVRQRLAPNGVAYVSYNAYPGCYLRQAIRHDLLHGVRNIDGRTAKVEAAMRRLQAWPDAAPNRGYFENAVSEEAARLTKHPINALAHDELSDAYHPVYLKQFAAECADNQLQVLCEADTPEIGEWFAPADIGDEASFDVVDRAQQQDFATNRFFRQSLLVGAETVISRRLNPAIISTLHVSSVAKRLGDHRFECDGASFDLLDPVMAGALDHLISIWPSTAPVASLVADEPRLLALVKLCGLKTVQFHSAPFGVALSDRPVASPLARLQARRGHPRLTTLRHNMVDLTDEFSRWFVADLDGSRTRAEIAQDVAEQLNLDPEAAMTSLDEYLKSLARAPILVG